jgi:hypothetical protein
MQAIQASLDGLAARNASPRRTSPTPRRRILDRLEPTITWAVVDASRKAEDVGHRITLLGGVDVIAITGIADTISPAAILSLGIPIGRIGSNPSTPGGLGRPADGTPGTVRRRAP